MRHIGICLGLLLALATPSSPGAELADMERRLQACAACHGEEGRSAEETYAPSIAGKPAGYLHQQLKNFRDGRRQQRVMQQMLAYLSDDYLEAMAAYYAAQRPAVAARQGAVSPAMLERGRRLVEEGDPARDLPACVACHGERLLGVAPAIPGLIALSADYLAAQLGAWRAGSRKAAPPDCMAAVAGRLERDEIAAVTAWIASRPVPEKHAPAPGLTHELPLPCGGVP
ncbi:MAG TPA: c-type cytochrome [Gammaproteobacteria bacterium]